MGILPDPLSNHAFLVLGGEDIYKCKTVIYAYSFYDKYSSFRRGLSVFIMRTGLPSTQQSMA